MTREQNQCTGSYPVSGYTREDGTKVDSYIRTCWKHSGGGREVQNTQDNIKTSNEKLDEIENKETITDEDLDLSRGYLSATISTVCEDCENYLDEKLDRPKYPTPESIEKDNILEKRKDIILDNLKKSMFAVDKIERIEKKKWGTVSTKDKDYGDKILEYAKRQKSYSKISKNLLNLHYSILHTYPIGHNYIADLKNTMSGLKTTAEAKLSEKAIDGIFYVGNALHATTQGAELWKYSKGEISAHDMSDKSNIIYGVHECKSINDIKDDEIRAKLKDKLSKETGLYGYNDLKGLVFNQTSTLSDKISKNGAFIKKIKELYKNTNKGTHTFKTSLNLWTSLNLVDIIIKDENNGNLTIVVIDLYNYNNDDNGYNQLGYNTQKANITEPYYVVVSVSIPISKIDK